MSEAFDSEMTENIPTLSVATTITLNWLNECTMLWTSLSVYLTNYVRGICLTYGPTQEINELTENESEDSMTRMSILANSKRTLIGCVIETRFKKLRSMSWRGFEWCDYLWLSWTLDTTSIFQNNRSDAKQVSSHFQKSTIIISSAWALESQQNYYN